MISIVYLHGFASGTSSAKARFFCDALTPFGVHVKVPDLAAGDFEHLTITRQLQVIERIVRHAAGPVRLIGSSMGGWLAALFAAHHRSVDRLVLLAPAFGFNQWWPQRLGQAEFDRWRSEDRLSVYHHGERAIRRIRFDLMRDALQYDDLPEVRQPTLLFHGTQDEVVPQRFSNDFAKKNPNVTLKLLDSGHDLLNTLNGITPIIVEFLIA